MGLAHIKNIYALNFDPSFETLSEFEPTHLDRQDEKGLVIVV